MKIREASTEDFGNIWPIFQEIVNAGETYPYPRDTSRQEAQNLWMILPQKTYVAEMNGIVVGTYYIKPNQIGSGSHVCNCGYMVLSSARGQGVATRLCEHSQITAIELGYKAMQFNLVVATNSASVHLWTKLGFETVGRLPMAFEHPREGMVDAFVMYKWLAE